MNTKSIILSALLVIVIAFLLGIALGYGMSKVDTDASAEVSVVKEVAVEAPRVQQDGHYEFYPFFSVKVVERCTVEKPILRKHNPCVQCARTYVHVVQDKEEDSNNDNDVVVTATPTPASSYTQPVPTSTPVPTATSTPVPESKHCDNGVGNGPDCPPPGHDKDNDGQADTPKGDNDDDSSNRPCGDKGNPCNKENGKNSIVLLPILNWIKKLLSRKDKNQEVYYPTYMGILPDVSRDTPGNSPAENHIGQHPMIDHFKRCGLIHLSTYADHNGDYVGDVYHK